MEKPKSTPLPWLVDGSTITTKIGRIKDAVVAIVRGPNASLAATEEEYAPWNGEAEANATLIVKCVTACDGLDPEGVPALVAAAKKAEDALSLQNETAMMAALDDLRKALTKAGAWPREVS